MKPEDLIGQKGGELSDEQQAAFDLQCFKEFARSFNYHPAWANAIATREDGLTPWQIFEEETGRVLPYFMAGRRVRKFNLLNLVYGRKLTQDPLLDTFEDVEDIADGKPVAMIYKTAADTSRHLPGTKMVLMTGQPSELTGVVVQRPRGGGLLWTGTYASWREWLVDGGFDLSA